MQKLLSQVCVTALMVCFSTAANSGNEPTNKAPYNESAVNNQHLIMLGASSLLHREALSSNVNHSETQHFTPAPKRLSINLFLPASAMAINTTPQHGMTATVVNLKYNF